MSINLVQWEGSTVTPKLDAIMYDDASYGIIKGCSITHQGTNLLKIAAGYIKIAGRLIEVTEETISCQVSSSGTVSGQLWIRLDLNSVTPVQFMSEAAAVLTPLTQETDCNFTNGVYELQLATYDVDESVISNLDETAPTLTGIRGAIDDIESEVSSIKNDLTAPDDVPFRFGKDADGNYGYIINEGGADTVIPFKSREKIEKVAEYLTADNASLSQTFTADKKGIYVVFGLSNGGSTRSQSITYTGTLKYDSGEKSGGSGNTIAKGRVLAIECEIGDTITVNHSGSGYGRGAFVIYRVSSWKITNATATLKTFASADGNIESFSLTPDIDYILGVLAINWQYYEKVWVKRSVCDGTISEDYYNYLANKDVTYDIEYFSYIKTTTNTNIIATHSGMAVAIVFQGY